MCKLRIVVLAVVLVFSAQAFGAKKIDLSNAVIVAPSTKKIRANAADMLRDEVEKRTRIGLDIASNMPGGDKAAILIGTGKELSRKGYAPPAGLGIPQKAEGYAVWVDSSKRKAVTVCLAGMMTGVLCTRRAGCFVCLRWAETGSSLTVTSSWRRRRGVHCEAISLVTGPRRIRMTPGRCRCGSSTTGIWSSSG